MAGKNLTKRNKGKYAFDESQVSRVLCLMCDKPIGDEDYVEEHITARWGRMMFSHARCAETGTQKLSEVD